MTLKNINITRARESLLARAEVSVVANQVTITCANEKEARLVMDRLFTDISPDEYLRARRQFDGATKKPT